jgi:hypothetical protein
MMQVPPDGYQVAEKTWDVIPEAAQRLSGIHDPGANCYGKTGVMDSGLDPPGRPGMTERAFPGTG